MKVLNFLFFILFIAMVSNVNFAKEIDDEYGSETQVETFATEDEDIVKKKFNYNETYGPTPIFSIGGGLSMNPGGYSLDTKLDIPYKDDLYIGPHIYYADSDDETNFGLTGNIKKILESEDPKIIPSVEVGIGVLVNDLENNNDDNSSYFLIQLGVGVDRVISDNMSVGVHLYNNYGTDFDDSTNHLTLVAGIQIRLY